MPLRPGPFKFEPKDINRPITDLYPTGRVIWCDDFDSTPIHMEPAQDAGGGVAAGSIDHLATDYLVFRGERSLYINSGYDAVVNSTMMAEQEFTLPLSKRLGLCGWWMIGSKTDLVEILMVLRFEWKDENKGYRGKLYWDAVNSELKIGVPGVDEVIVGAPTEFGVGRNNWEYWKLMVDGNQGKYIGVFVGGKYFDLSDKSLETIIPDEEHHVELRVGLTNSSKTAAKTMYWDDMILTCDE